MRKRNAQHYFTKQPQSETLVCAKFAHLLLLEKPRDFDPFGQTGFAHLWLQYDCPFKVLVLGVNIILPF